MRETAQSLRSISIPAIALIAVLQLCACRCSADAGTSPSAADLEYFEKSVRPLLVEQCFGCHGATATGANGGLRMLGRADLLKGGARGPALVAGHPETSLLVRAIGYTENGLAMPPRAKMTDSQIGVLTEWIRRGAPWPESKSAPKQTPASGRVFDLKARRAAHWAWQPVRRPAVPLVKNTAWASSPIDAFLLAKLEAKGITPAKPADRRTLIRRLTFDLIGLPPTPDEVNAFVADRSPNAYRKVVDRLLASPHYGERWGRHWLDLVRYAETDGHEFDLEKPGAYQYRDYVIRALNADVSYKQFAMEQLAGDLLQTPRLNPDQRYNESVLGTGFFWLGSGTHSPVDLLDDQADHMDNEIDVLSKTFLGIGVGCARCHDHKFDAVSQKDYYGLFGILKSTRKQVASVGPPPDSRILVELASIHNEINHSLITSARMASISGSRLSDPRWKPAIEASRADLTGPLYPWSVLSAASPESFSAEKSALLKKLQDQTDRAKSDETSIEWFTGSAGAADTPLWVASGPAFHKLPIQHPEVNVRLSGSAPQVSGALCASIADSGLLSDKLHGDVRSRTFTIDKPHVVYRMAGRGARLRLVVDGLLQLRDPLYGGLVVEPDSESMKWYVQDVSRWIGHHAYIELQDVDTGYIALDRVGFTSAGAPAEAPNPLIMEALRLPDITSSANLNDEYMSLFRKVMGDTDALPGSEEKFRDELRAWMVRWAPLLPDTAALLADLVKRRADLEQQIAIPSPALAAADGTGENERVHMRGNYRTQGAEAPRRFLEACDGPISFAASKGCGRLELAERITAPSDPLFARVMVNRLWQHLFGEGIVRTPDDFGVMGRRPTHPELLDWLASEFVREGWSLKNMQRLMVTTSAYRMDSQSEAKADFADPQNLLLHRMPVRRMEAECIRDSILAVSGRLDQAVGGPPVMPNLTAFTPGRGAPASGPVDGGGRRSIYISVRRGFPVPMLTAFDLPVPMTTIGHRTVSSVPAQALTLLNDPVVVEQAAIWAKRLLNTPGTTEHRVRSMYEAAFARPPDSPELAAAVGFIGATPASAGTPEELQAWSSLCHVMFNVKEFIFLR